MNSHLNPLLFERVMRLAPHTRADLLEFLGSAELDTDDIETLIDSIESRAAEAEPVTQQ
jgi:hypothetical protein